MTTAPNSRESSLAGQLARLGFRDAARAERLLADPALAGLIDPLEDVFDDGLLAALSSVPQPDQALLSLVRLMESLERESRQDDAVGRERHRADPAGLRALVRTGGPVRDRLFAVLGTSVALGDHLAKHPGDWTALESEEPWTADELRAELVRAVGGDPDDEDPVADVGQPAYDALRRAYRRRLLAVAGRDLRGVDPAADFPGVAPRAGRPGRGCPLRRSGDRARRAPGRVPLLPARRDRHGQDRRARAQLCERCRRGLRGRSRPGGWAST